MRVSASQRPAKAARRDQRPARCAAKNCGGDATTTKGAARSKTWKGSCCRARLYRLIEE